MLGAGTETTAWTLSVTLFYILSNPEIHARLISELRPVFGKSGGKPSWTQLEQIPYFHGVISEGLRLSFGVTAPLPRIAPDEVLGFGNWMIPAGVSSFFLLARARGCERAEVDNIIDTSQYDICSHASEPQYLSLP